MFITILEALIALPKIGSLVSLAVEQIVTWYILKQNRDTYAAIADAAALAMRAKTDEDRFIAAESWRAVLTRARVQK